jgi:hypothetical protein
LSSIPVISMPRWYSSRCILSYRRWCGFLHRSALLIDYLSRFAGDRKRLPTGGSIGHAGPDFLDRIRDEPPGE